MPVDVTCIGISYFIADQYNRLSQFLKLLQKFSFNFGNFAHQFEDAYKV